LRSELVLHSVVISRHLFRNTITAISNGTFAGLASLTTLFGYLYPSTKYLCMIRVSWKVPIFKPDHIDIERLIRWTRQLDHTVWFFVSGARSICASFECHEQVHVFQSHHSDIKRRLLWSWQHDRTVWLLDSLHDASMLHSSVINRSLYNNRITSIPSGAFTGLGSLTSLFGHLDPLHEAIGINLRAIDRYLYNNQITSIPNEAFTGLGNLTKLFVPRTRCAVN
jgi:hypothetical protein